MMRALTLETPVGLVQVLVPEVKVTTHPVTVPLETISVTRTVELVVTSWAQAALADAATGPTGSVLAVDEPEGFVAVTLTRTYLSASSLVRTYPLLVAPEIFVHVVWLVETCHW
jgi:hypothetical protein